MVVLSVRAYCSATPPWYAAAAVRTPVSRSRPASSALLGVDAELVAVAGDRGVEDLGVRREDERRELRQRRVERELRLHRVPVLRVDVGSCRGGARRRCAAQDDGALVGGGRTACRRSRIRRAARPRRRPDRRRARRVETRGSPAHLGGGWLGGAMSASGSTRDCDVVVLGLGPGGEHAARKLGEAGLDVIGVDEALVGGECPFWGCTPSKLMVRPADLIAEVRRADRLAGEVTGVAGLVAGRGADPEGQPRLDRRPARRAARARRRPHRPRPRPARRARRGPRRDRTATRPCCAPPAASCSTPAPSRCGRRSPGSTDTPYWTNRETMKVTEVPDRLVVVGGGPNGLELAQVFARYGAQVTLLELADRIAATEEPEASDVLTTVLRDEGIEVRGRRRGRAGRPRRRVPRATSADEVLDADQLLVAAGRSPNLADVGLETVGLDPEADTRRDRRAHAGRRAALGGRRHHREGRASRTSRATRPPARSRTSSARGRAAGGLPGGLPGHLHRPGAGLGRDDRAPGPRGRALGAGSGWRRSSGPRGAGCTDRAPPASSRWSRTPTGGCWWARPSWRRTAAR